MKAIVAGASGFLGGYLLEALREEGVEPIALVRRGSRVEVIDRLGIEKRNADLSEAGSLPLALRGGDIVFNLAGKVADWGSWREFRELNVEGTAQLLSTSAENRIKRFVQVSSFSAYGMRFFGSETLSEEKPYRPSPLGRDFYCRSKQLAEEEVKRACAETGMGFVILRPGIILGERDSSVSRRIVSLIQGHKRILNVGRLEERIQLTHGKDVARAIILAGLHGPANQAYNISSPPEVSKSEFWSKALKALGVQKGIREVPYPLALLGAWMMEKAHLLSGDGIGPQMTLWSVYVMGNRNVIDGSKISDLGWRPKVDTREAIQRAFGQYASGLGQTRGNR
jgi:nucleoside-diphosphate-sugar epimerase